MAFSFVHGILCDAPKKSGGTNLIIVPLKANSDMYLQLGVFVLPCGWDTSPSHGSPSLNSLAPICTPGWREALEVTCDGHLVQRIRNNYYDTLCQFMLWRTL